MNKVSIVILSSLIILSLMAIFWQKRELERFNRYFELIREAQGDGI